MYTKAFEKLAAALSRGAIVLTVNARLTRHLAAEYDLAMRRSGKTAWTTPAVMPFYSWVSGLWEEYGSIPALTGLRARVLWEKVVTADPQAPGSWPSSAVAGASFEAMRLMSEYGLELPKEEIYLTEEAKALKRWSASYGAELKRFGFIGEAELAFEVKRLIERGAQIPGEIILAGFDELSPAVSSIAGALTRQGAAVTFWPGAEDAAPSGEAGIIPCHDEEDEVIRAARWVRAVYTPGKRIGVIVPDLEQYRKAILREFTAELSPGAVLPEAPETSVFNISLGAPLSEEPLVGSALDILSIGEGKVKAALLLRALSSPFLSGRDALSFSKLDLKLRDENRMEASLFEGKALLHDEGAFLRLTEWLSWLKAAGKKQAPSAWAKAFTDLLGRIGWLKGMKLSSREYQALGAWNKALEGFACLDDVLGKISRAEAVSKFSAIVRETIHQVETPDADIQVLGLLEATGLWFDHIRVLGCHEYALPSEPSPNPFIPRNLQAAKGVPHSTSERELEFAKAITKRLLSSAPSVVVSWPVLSDDRELRVSPFFSGCAVLDEGALPSSRLLDMARAPMEDVPQDAPLPVGAQEKGALRGGTSILKNQSMCPFRAFAIHRLHAIVLPETELDLKSETRGSILHEAMKLFWEDVKDSRRLRELKDSGGLEKYVEAIASKALEGAKVPPPLSKRFMELEHKRLSNLLMDWAELELQRGVGFRVKTVELEKELEIGGLAIKGRVDRIDELEGGGELIIDYKTGSPRTKDWLTKRPMDPQLLVYSIDSAVEAVSFARVVPGECKFLGIAKDKPLPGMKPYDNDKFRQEAGDLDWDGLMRFWKEALEGLAKDFLAGVCDVDPNNLPNDNRACKYCGLEVLCRASDEDTDGNDDDSD
jgi:ATP-dependent helicase/nuclease subunit B